MSKYKEFKKILKQVHITNENNFNNDLQNFLDTNPEVKIVNTIVHKPYHVTIIYEVSVPV